jgi:hypothetical protein
MDINVEKNKGGRPKGSGNKKHYNWNVILFDKDSNTFKKGKYISVNDINADLGLKLNSDYVRRIMTKYRVDTEQKFRNNSFLARYGHISIEKIKEPIF